MTAVFAIMTVSLLFRLVGSNALYGPAVGLATAGLVLAGVGMYLGGHVVYRFGTQVNRVAFVEGGPTRAFAEVGRPEDFPEGEMKMVEAKGMPVLVVRLEGTLRAIVNVCTHAGGPLNEGELQGTVVECPWHGSRFSVLDGSCRGGPATFSEPRLDVEERDGTVQVKLAEPLR
jgi:nitrite reductase/ring-hydroxylating ferredoxin subunit